MFLIGIDLDSTVVNLLEPWAKVYNEKFKDAPIPPEQFIGKTWELERFGKDKMENILNILQTPGFFRNLPPLKGAIEGVNRLRFLGNRIVFVTSAPEGTIDDKVYWVKKHFKWAKARDIITTGRKELVYLDVLIDDRPDTILNYRRKWPDKKILSLAWPYNRHVKQELNLLAESGEDPENGWDEIVRFVEEEIDLFRSF